ncbi:MAG: hypothetical protein V3V08_22060 [Nannocystaceae bacterium]
MEPLEQATERARWPRSKWRELANDAGMSIKRLKKIMKRSSRGEQVWLNGQYVVHKRVRDDGWTELSLRRQDRAPITDWRHKQQIKNQLCGPECEGVELYPAESRLMDTSNQYWLFVRTAPGDRIPVGFTVTRKVTTHKGVGGSVQRPPGEEE